MPRLCSRKCSTSQKYVLSDIPYDPGQQFVVDAFTHHSVGSHGFVYAHLFTDLASRQVYPVFTKTKLVAKFKDRMAVLFHAHPEWKPNGTAIDRKIKVDMEAGYQSNEFADFCHSLGYRIETSPTHDKHAHSVAECPIYPQLKSSKFHLLIYLAFARYCILFNFSLYQSLTS